MKDNMENNEISASAENVEPTKPLPLIKFSDFFPILKTCFFIVLLVTIFSFGLTYIISKISPYEEPTYIINTK